MAAVTRLRRSEIPVSDPADNITLAAIVLRCARCGSTWQARLGPFGDDVDQDDARCPGCNPEPPAAA